jgi:peptide/nickel transport system permease protein
LLYLAPGGPMSEILETRRQSGSSRFPLKPEDIERLQRQYDLDLPLWQSYTRWAFGWPDLPDRKPRGGVIRGDLGVSWRISQNESTTAVIMRVLPNTLILMLSATIFSLLIAVPIGIYSAVHQYSKLDYLVTSGAFFGTAMPVFWLGSMLILLFALKFKDWNLPYLPSGGVLGARDYRLPIFGMIDAGSGFDRFLRLIMPTVTLSLLYLATWSRYTRTSMLEVLRQDYVRTARAKGLMERAVIFKHTLRNALIPLVTIVTLQIPGLFGGAILTETTFNYRGMGLLLIDSLFQSDWPVALAYLMIQSALIVGANLLADVLYTVVDPRIRYS